MQLKRSPRPDWSPLPRAGAVGVEGRVHLVTKQMVVAHLRFSPRATIDEHPGERHCHVICLEGRGLVSVGDERSAFEAGDRVFWPAGIPHCLWTEDASMETLMVELLQA